MAFTDVTPYLYYPDADAAIGWLQRVLGFGPARRWGKEVELTIGDTHVDFSERSPGADEGGGALLIVHLDDIDAYYERVRAAAGTGVAPPEDEPYGPRAFHVTDPWGYRWYFWQGEVTAEPDPPA